MPVMQGKDMVMYVETAVAGTYIIVNDLTRIAKSASRSTDRTAVFGRTTPYAVTGAKEASYDAAGLLNPGDAGQQRLRDMEATDTPVNIKVMFDGTNGFTQQVKVSAYGFDVAPEGLQGYTFSLIPTADAVIIGTGPLL